ncbi:Uncharacterized conserved protein, DUF885 familyt [Frankineae bacterium MT45]|nr:Uncharacterized conserved protein, DUF885 familyt [Frankineae bacterium MT45]
MADLLRPASPVDALLERYLDEHAALDPIFATTQGLLGFDAQLPDLSPDGLAARSQLRRRTLAELDQLDRDGTALDGIDRVSVAAAREQLGVEELLHEQGEDVGRLNNIASPVQDVRDVFDLMPTDSPADWEVITERLRQVKPALQGYIESLRSARAHGRVAPARQVEAAIRQAQENVGPDGFFAKLSAGNDGLGAGPALTSAAESAAAAYQALATFLADELRPHAPAADPVGQERYALLSRSFLGTSVDLAQTYEWGQQELARIAQEMRATAGRIRPGASVAEAVQHLESDPSRRLADAEALRRWMQGVSDDAIAALSTQFDIPEPVRRLECRIAPTSSGVIYYTGPSEDFSRPGRMWWSIPAGMTEFTTWQERTTVYHEGVPGHHLQIGQTVYRRELLNRWRRLGCWVSGHGEGWALYAEQLMAELGYLDDPGDYLGMLSGQSLRAARVVLDIGVHCEFPAPAEFGGGAWTYEKAWSLLSTYCLQPTEVLRFELERYLGWPGQAPSYKLGERAWLQLREEAQRAAERDGGSFDLKAFHRRALDIGSVGLDVLRAAVLESS